MSKFFKSLADRRRRKKRDECGQDQDQGNVYDDELDRQQHGPRLDNEGPSRSSFSRTRGHSVSLSMSDAITAVDSSSQPKSIANSRVESSPPPFNEPENPIGLTVLHIPPMAHVIDIIFVHGLGGSSHRTWTWNRDKACFWPKEWLPAEPEMNRARILTFGYCASYKSAPNNIFDIHTFARSLLFQLKFGGGKDGALGVGKVPIIFVVHSMGGLVVKKALILGLHDPQYQAILNIVRSIIFLATPHRGNSMAETLNRFLKVTFSSPQKFIGELQKNATGIEDINDQFRHLATQYYIFSFFETLPSSIGPAGLNKMFVVERDSAILGYPSEIAAPLNADHRAMSKYPSQQDPNYQTVKDAIRSMVRQFRQNHLKRERKLSSSTHSASQTSLQDAFEALFSVVEPGGDLYNIYENYYLLGSGEWILSSQDFHQWLHSDVPGPCVLHVTGHAGSGKTVLASFIIKYLERAGNSVQYFFFRFDNQHTKRSLRSCLLSLAFQLAKSNAEYKKRLRNLLDHRSSVAKADIRRLWQKLFTEIFIKLDGSEPIYWVIDAIDESDCVTLFLNLLLTLEPVPQQVRILFMTRPHSVGHAFGKFKTKIRPSSFFSTPMATPEKSLEMYIIKELSLIQWPGDPGFMDYMTQSLLGKCQGNFLWLRLAVRQLVDCDYPQQAHNVLEATPRELADVYERIQSRLASEMPTDDQHLAVRILTWITCSEHQLTLDEMSEALQDTSKPIPMLHLKHTINRLCGDLVVVDDTSNKISMVHHTAKEFLTQTSGIVFHVDTASGHGALLDRCLQVVTDPKFRLRIKKDSCQGFLHYACMSWSRHLAEVDEILENPIRRVVDFISNKAVLSWIETVCEIGKLHVLTIAAKNMNSFCERRRCRDANTPPHLHLTQELDLISTWATELLRLVGKFGLHLSKYPKTIHDLVPAFCPPKSATRRQFTTQQPTLTVSGIRSEDWDDSLASFSVGHNYQPTKVFCMEKHFAMHTGHDTVTSFYVSTFQEFRNYCHQEFIVALNFNQDGNRLVTCSSETIKVWDVDSGRLLFYYSNPVGSRAVGVALTHDSSRVTMCCTDGYIRFQIFDEPESWHTVIREIPEDGSLGTGGGTPNVVAFSPDGRNVAIAFRGRPIGLWSTDSGRLIGKCYRPNEGTIMGTDFVPYPQSLTWNPVLEHVVGLYNDSVLFKWNPVEAHSEILKGPFYAHQVACSPDGRFIVTASQDGSLRIWHYDTFGLMYHLSCASVVTDIAISTDARLIFDLRESFCNVWQPNALLRFLEADEKASETSSGRRATEPEIPPADQMLALGSEMDAAILEPITCLATAKHSEAYCFSNDNGSLSLKMSDTSDAKEVRNGFVGASQLAFSEREDLIACVEFDSSVLIRRVSDRETALLKSVKLETGLPVQQILWLKNDTQLLTTCSEWITVWSVLDGTVQARLAGDYSQVHLLRHPSDDAVLFLLFDSRVDLIGLRDLSTKLSWGLDLLAYDDLNYNFDIAPTSSQGQATTHPVDPDEQDANPVMIDRVLECQRNMNVLIQVSKATNQGKRRTNFFLVDLSSLESTAPIDDSVRVIKAKALPETVLKRIEIPIGFVAGGLTVQGSTTRRASYEKCSLAFIDQDFWVCTWTLDDPQGARIRTHFFLPRDWINISCLNKSVMSLDGRFICPRNGEVVIVAGGLKETWTG